MFLGLGVVLSQYDTLSLWSDRGKSPARTAIKCKQLPLALFLR